MKGFISRLLMLVLTIHILSCEEDKIVKADDRKVLVVGQWNSYEIGSSSTGFNPGRESLLTLVYASGMVFYADNNFAMRFYDNDGWEDGGITGTYGFVDDQTIELVFFPNTMDESKLELQIDKLNRDVFWFRHSHWVNDQNPNPIENHLERVK